MPCAMISSRLAAAQVRMRSHLVVWTGTQARTIALFSDSNTRDGHGAHYTDPISPLFDADFNLPWWQGQLIETHTFGSSAASQFLAGGFLLCLSGETKNPSQALAAFPTVLNFGVPGTFTTLGGGDNYSVWSWEIPIRSINFPRCRENPGQTQVRIRCELRRIYWSVPP